LESKLTNVESKLLLQLLLCGFDICLFLFDRTAKINLTEVSTCRGSFGWDDGQTPTGTWNEGSSFRFGTQQHHALLIVGLVVVVKQRAR
jgi:hypothetical protein